MKQFSSHREHHSTRSVGFTLIEMLVVIGIIAILAALVVGGAGIAQAKSRRARVETERGAMVVAIDTYKKDKGYYPPDSGGTQPPYETSLFYELTGCTNSTVTGGPPSFYSKITGENLTTNSLATMFNVGGILNSSSDPSAVTDFLRGLKNSQHSLIKTNNAGGASVTFSVLGVGVAGPVQLSPAPGSVGSGLINPWNYVVTNPTNNSGTYDLWMDVSWSGHTNRVSNWSAQPTTL